MKRLTRLVLAALCALALTVCASAASVQTMDVALTVDENGTARAEARLTLQSDEPLDTLSIGLGPNVSGVHVDGFNAGVSRSGGQSTVTLSDENGLRFPLNLHLSYTIRNTVEAGSESQQFHVRLLGAIRGADIEKFSAKVQMPGHFEGTPEFSSGYYADGIDNYLNIRVSPDGLITVGAMEPLLAGETLDLRIETAQDYFALHNVAGRTLLIDRIAIIALLLFGAVYWWRALRSPLPRITPQTRAPMGVEPGVAAMLLIGQKPDLDLMVLNWAACGYLRAARLRGGRLLLTRRIPMGNERSSYEQEVFAQLFAKKDTVASGTGAWAAAAKKADKAARKYWFSRLFAERPGRPGLLRACAVLICGFAALSCADRDIPGMTLRPLLLAAAILAGLVWGAAVQYALGRLPMRGRKKPILVLVLCLAVLIAALRLSSAGGPLVLAALASVLVSAALVFGPKRRRGGVQLMSELLGWRTYLRTLTPDSARKLLKADPQYYYRTLLYAEALGVGDKFSRAFDGCRLDECAYFEPGEKPTPRQALKFRGYLRGALAYARGDWKPGAAQKRAPSGRPQPQSSAGRRRNNNHRAAETEDLSDL